MRAICSRSSPLAAVFVDKATAINFATTHARARGGEKGKLASISQKRGGASSRLVPTYQPEAPHTLFRVGALVDSLNRPCRPSSGAFSSPVASAFDICDGDGNDSYWHSDCASVFPAASPVNVGLHSFSCHCDVPPPISVQGKTASTTESE